MIAANELIGMIPIPGRPAVKKVLAEAVVLHEGWEMDNRAWKVELEDRSLAVLCTSHGEVIEWSVRQMLSKLEETKASASSIEALLGQQKGVK